MDVAKEKGLVIVHTGDGKGKTTAALGLALRAFGDGLRVLILQFIKGGQKYGELTALARLAEHSAEGNDSTGKIVIKQCGKGFTKRGGSEEEHKAAATAALHEAQRAIKSGEWDMVILDEINYAVKFGLVAEVDVLELADIRPKKIHLVFTGRDALPALVERADLVTEMRAVKHPFQSGITAQKGIEF